MDIPLCNGRIDTPIITYSIQKYGGINDLQMVDPVYILYHLLSCFFHHILPLLKEAINKQNIIKKHPLLEEAINKHHKETSSTGGGYK